MPMLYAVHDASALHDDLLSLLVPQRLRQHHQRIFRACARKSPHRRASAALRPWSAGRRGRSSALSRSSSRGRPCRRRRTSPAMLSMSAICCSRPAETRFVPFSYFCTCWNVSPMPSARLDCDRPRCSRSARILRPISTSSAPARRLRVAPRADSIKLPPSLPTLLRRNQGAGRQPASESMCIPCDFP